MPTPPLLRSPPFLGIAPAVASVSSTINSIIAPFDRHALDALLTLIRTEQVGGEFWQKPYVGDAPSVVLRPAFTPDIEGLGKFAQEKTLWVLPKDSRVGKACRLFGKHRPDTIVDVNPWSVLNPGCVLHAHGDDEWLALAFIAGAGVQLLSTGRFGVAGDTKIGAPAVYRALSTEVAYRDPFGGSDASIEATIARLGLWRRIFEANQDIIAACGISWWKRPEIARFLGRPASKLFFYRSEGRAISCAARRAGAVAIWPSRVSAGITRAAHAKKVQLVRIEDGFVRSVGLGSNLVPPSSIAVDRRGIHYDPGRPSDLETLLAETDFTPSLLARSERLRQKILDAGISKYGGDTDLEFPARKDGHRVVLVPGQVEDDMSVRLGGGGLSSNLELLRRARSLEPDAEIWFRPHPDVDAGHRKGAVNDTDILCHAERIVRGGSMARLLDQVDAVHVLTSLTGFEALMRDRKVTCHGTPFFAGWGLTHDLAPVSERRGRQLTVNELVAAVLILYPRYLDPVTGLPCSPEVLIDRMNDGDDHNRLSWVTNIRQFQGRIMRRWA